MVIPYRPIDKVVDFLTSIPQPREVLAYQPAAEDVARFEYLVHKNKTAQLSIEESEELEQFLMLDHMMIVAKKKARKLLGGHE